MRDDHYECMEFDIVWFWAACAAILLIGEMVTVSFGLLFFGVAAGIVAVLSLIFPNFSLEFQIIVFAILGILGAYYGRKTLKKYFVKPAPGVDGDSNAIFVVDDDLAPGASGTVTYQGAPWTAINESSEEIKKGDQVQVIRTSGIKLIIKKMRKG